MITINVKKNFAEVTYSENERQNKTISKIISLGDLHKIFSERSCSDTGSFPIFGNENSIGINRIIKKGTNILVLVQGVNLFGDLLATDIPAYEDIDEMKVDFVLKNGVPLSQLSGEDDFEAGNGVYFRYTNIHMPNLLMAISMKEKPNGKLEIAKTGLNAFAEPVLHDKATIYRFPFSNIYSETSGKICWGDNQLPILDNVGQSISLLSKFISAPMNNDLFNGYHSGKYSADSCYDLLFKLSKESEKLQCFPYEEYKMEAKCDYKSLINYYITNWI